MELDGQSQLRFNLAQPPELGNLATSSGPRGHGMASPVVIEKLGHANWAASPVVVERVGHRTGWAVASTSTQPPVPPSRASQDVYEQWWNHQVPAVPAVSLEQAVRLAQYDVEHGTASHYASSIGIGRRGGGYGDALSSEPDDSEDGGNDRRSQSGRRPARTAKAPLPRTPVRRGPKYQPSRHFRRDCHDPHTASSHHHHHHQQQAAPAPSWAPSEAPSRATSRRSNGPLTVLGSRKAPNTKRLVEGIVQVRAEMKQHLIKARLQAEAEGIQSELLTQLMTRGAPLRAFYTIRQGLHKLIKEMPDSPEAQAKSKGEILARFLSLHRSAVRHLRSGTGLPHEELTALLADLATETDEAFRDFGLPLDQLVNLHPVLSGLATVREGLQGEIQADGRPAWDNDFQVDRDLPAAVLKHNEDKALRLDGGDRKQAKREGVLQAAIAALARSKGLPRQSQPGGSKPKKTKGKTRKGSARRRGAAPNKGVLISRPPRPRHARSPARRATPAAEASQARPPTRKQPAAESDLPAPPSPALPRRAVAWEVSDAVAEPGPEDEEATPHFARATTSSAKKRELAHVRAEPREWAKSLGNQPQPHQQHPPFVAVGKPRPDNTKGLAPGSAEWVALETKKRAEALLSLENRLRTQRQGDPNVGGSPFAAAAFASAPRLARAWPAPDEARPARAGRGLPAMGAWQPSVAVQPPPTTESHQNVEALVDALLDDLLLDTVEELDRLDDAGDAMPPPPPEQQRGRRVAWAEPGRGYDAEFAASQMLARAAEGDPAAEPFREPLHILQAGSLPATRPARFGKSVGERIVPDSIPGDILVRPLPGLGEQEDAREHPMRSGRTPRPSAAARLVQLPVTDGLIHAAAETRAKFQRHLKVSSACDLTVASPWALVDRLSEQFLEELLGAVAQEMLGDCDRLVDTMVESELTAS